MSPSRSSPPQSPTVTTSDELHTRSVESPAHNCQNSTVRHTIIPQPNSPSPSIFPPAPPKPPVSFHCDTVSAHTSIPAIQPEVQPNSSLQKLSTASISFDSNPSCLMPTELAVSLRRDQPVGLPSQSLHSGTIDPNFLNTKSKQSVTPSFSFPPASNHATTHDRLFQDSTYSQCTLKTVSSTETISSTSHHTPNVYINGLPPHFSEQELFALARPFGNIKSVRTFTRHVSEKPTGYGFVLFSDLESAQRCIESLRKCRNLHPSFSKQVHRIPGTEYAQNTVQSTDQDENSFKSRMEKLKDATSTNLYIEGLPLSIDEENLTALVRPYKIKSSRFFKTKLSNPPRIIAFVRLETRTAAEEVIERLHGRMVRGWNDPGCRISVRFADSTEQRELRRTERTLKNEDQSPSRLTIAQAALLNLRGQEFRASVRNVMAGRPQRLTSLSPGNHATFSPIADDALLPASHSLPSKVCYTYRESPLIPMSNLSITSEMDNLVQSVQNMGYGEGSLGNTMRGLALDNDYLVTRQLELAQLQAFAGAPPLSPNSLPVTLSRGHAQARNGFTPAEELILEAHAQRLQLQAQLSQPTPMVESLSSPRKLNANVQSFNPTYCEPLQAGGEVILSHDNLPSISEDEFHAMGHYHLNSLLPTSYEPQEHLPTVSIPTGTAFVPPPSRAVSIVPPPPDYEESGKRSKGHHQPQRITFPPSTFNSRQSTLLSDNKSRASLLRASTRPNNISGVNNNKSNTSTISSDRNTENQHTYMYSHGDTRSCPEDSSDARFRLSPTSHIYTKPPQHHSTAKEGPKSPAIVSPALTYSSRTPSTLSPATPFFGSFPGNQDTFEAVVTTENEDEAEKKLMGGVINK